MANSASEPIKNDKFWEQQSYEKCLSLWASAALGQNVQVNNIITGVVTGAYWDLFQAIKADGKKRFFEFDKISDDRAFNEFQSGNLPIVDVNKDIDVSDIPF